MLLNVVCTAGEFVWNEGGVVQLHAPYIMLSDFWSALATAPAETSAEAIGQP
jgi:hypothetical protein